MEFDHVESDLEFSFIRNEGETEVTIKPNIRDFTASSSELPERDLHPNY